MKLIESQSNTGEGLTQLRPSSRHLLLQLGEAKLRLRRYRALALSSNKADAAARLVDGILLLEAAESEKCGGGL